MTQVSANYLAILVCGVINMILGFLWYGPLFGKSWSKMMGFDMSDKKKMAEMQKKATPGYIVMFLTSLIMAYVLTKIIQYAGVTTGTGGVLMGFWVWLGFVVPPTLANNIFGGKNLKLWVIDSGYYLVSLVIFGVILTKWVV